MWKVGGMRCQPETNNVSMLIRAEADNDGFLVIPRWAAEASGLREDQRRIAMRPDGSLVLAHLAPAGCTPCRVPAHWPADPVG